MIRDYSSRLALAVFLAAAGLAAAEEGDPPARVARLNYQSGAVSFRPGAVEEWTAATLNYPLTTGDHLWTEDSAQAEMHIGSTAIRMAPRTALAFFNLDDRTVQLSLTEGSLYVTIRNQEGDEVFEVDTPNAAITLLRPGSYRIDADADNGVTAVTVREGEAEVTGAGNPFSIRQRQSARITGVDSVSQEVGSAPRPNDFEEWCEARDRREGQSESVRYVGPEMTGQEDLGDYGVWREEEQYGWIWMPRTVPTGWAPYRYGHWVWIDPWGWTWVDDEPWGFAPYHYGRWAQIRGVWVWVPGARVARPVYAPALVVFVGGPGFGVSFGNVAAWFPLGPREPYRPGYHVSNIYLRRVNGGHVSDFDRIRTGNIRYVNHGNLAAISAVSHDTFTHGRPVYRHGVAVPPGELARAEAIGATPPVVPRRESVLAGEIRTGPPPVRYTDRAVVVRRTPPALPVSFEAKQEALRRNPGRPLDPAAMESIRERTPARGPMVRTLPAGGNNSGLPGQQPAGQRQGGWRRVESQPAEAPAAEREPVIRRRDPEPRSETPVRVEPRRVEPPRPKVESPRREDSLPGTDRTPSRKIERPERVEQPREERPARTMERKAEPRSERPAVREQKPEKEKEKRDPRKDDQ